MTIRLPVPAVLLLLIATAPHPEAAAQKRAASAEIRPAAIYHNYCSVCHGDKGDGNSRAKGSMIPPPKDLTSPQVAAQMTRQHMIDAVTNGRSGTAMTGWKTQLSAREIEAVVDYIRNNFMPASISAGSSRGRVVYAEYCSVCHGERGDGNSRAKGSLVPAPRDFTTALARTELTRERMVRSVTFGRPETAMTGWRAQLNPKDIDAVVDYIRTGFMGAASHEGISGTSSGGRLPAPLPGSATSAPARPVATLAPAKSQLGADMKAPFANGLKGDAVKGAALYMSNCSACHGTTGDGRGPRAYFIMPKPRNFLHDAARAELNRPALYRGTSEGKLGTDMPAWGKVLEPQQLADVSEFVFQRFILGTDAPKSRK